MTKSQSMATGSSSYTLLGELSPMVVVVNSNARWWRRIKLPKPWILQRPINGKLAPPVVVVSRKWQRESEEQNLSGGVAQLRWKCTESGRQFRGFSQLRSVAFQTLSDDEDGKEMIGVARAFDRYQTWLVGWPELQDPTGSRSRVGLTQFGFFSPLSL